jgi:hypothetical protein
VFSKAAKIATRFHASFPRRAEQKGRKDTIRHSYRGAIYVCKRQGVVHSRETRHQQCHRRAAAPGKFVIAYIAWRWMRD